MQVITHVVGDGHEAVHAALNVLVCPAAEGGYVAQGIEIYHVATGATEAEARAHFAETFTMTIAAYLRRGRSLAGMFKHPSPADVRMRYFASGNQDQLECLVLQGIPDTAPVPRALKFVTADCIAA